MRLCCRRFLLENVENSGLMRCGKSRRLLENELHYCTNYYLMITNSKKIAVCLEGQFVQLLIHLKQLSLCYPSFIYVK
jgi:hypothetical protein